MVQASGLCDPGFELVRETFEENFECFDEVGASFAASIEGELVVDLWAGHKDAAKTQPWTSNTIVNVFSCTKAATCLCIYLLVDRGLLELDTPIADYWPEFGSNNKAGITARHVLTHSAGLPGFSRKLDLSEFYDWSMVIKDLASQSPWWEPGSALGYHAFTQGYLLGELVRRIDGRSVGQFFREEVAVPLEADFHIGLDESDFHRVADLVPFEVNGTEPQPEEGSIAARVFADMALSNDDILSPAWRKAEIPAVNGHGNAKALVNFQTPLANLGSGMTTQLLQASTCEQIGRLQISGVDLVLGIEMRMASGLALPTESLKASPNPNALWWGGAGGSLIVVDQANRTCFSYVMNKLENHVIGDPRALRIGQALYKGLGI